jgi:hypothetical protein
MYLIGFPHPQELALTSPTGSVLSGCIVRLRTQATEFSNAYRYYRHIPLQKTKTKLHGLSRERTIPTERPPLFGEVIANLCG